MDKTEFKILDALARNIGRPLSITDLAKESKYHYKNIYDKTKELSDLRILKMESIGNSTRISLNFSNIQTSNFLGQMELQKEMGFIFKRPNFGIMTHRIKMRMMDYPFIESISLIDAERNSKLGRAEILIILNEPLPMIRQGGRRKANEKEMEAAAEKLNEDIKNISVELETISDANNIRLDYLIITTGEFDELLRRSEYNPIKHMISNRIEIFSPYRMWNILSRIISDGYSVRMEPETETSKIGDADIGFNLRRLGYSEFGRNATNGKAICIESIITAILLKQDSRLIESIPIILKKNKANFSLLTFLSRKYNKAGELLEILEIMDTMSLIDVWSHIDILKNIMMIKRTEKLDEDKIIEKLRLYNAVG